MFQSGLSLDLPHPALLPPGDGSSVLTATATPPHSTAREADLGTEPAPAGRTTPAPDPFAFVVRLGRALHRYGTPAYRLEPYLERVALRLGLRVEASAQPTALHVSFVDLVDPATVDRSGTSTIPGTTRFVRVHPGEDDLGRLAELDRLAYAIEREGIDLEEATQRLDAILTEPDAKTIARRAAGERLAYALASAAAACFFEASGLEVFAAALVGYVVGSLQHLASRWRTPAPLAEGGTALFVTLLVAAAAPIGIRDLVVLAGLIVLVPGLRLTTAASELATGHLASGVARLASSAVSFAALAYGVVLGHRVATALELARHIPWPPAWQVAGDASPDPLPALAFFTALAAAPFAFAVILRAARRDVVWIAATAPIALLAALGGGRVLGAEQAGLVGAFAITVVSNALAHVRNRPASITLVPGLLLLVPGSLGFRSLAAMLDLDVVPGMESATRMLVVAISLVAGMLAGGVIVRARPTL
jgi:uncharacterized membrane protein YjjP (DUF1212 family)